ncbi:hypothetical protein NNO_1200 [Hydrogenimonas sp.]|nr:hypothetical protein NNO_1200 [Hydrogenimonas sp.]
MENIENINISSYIKNKLRRLHKDKLYDYSIFEPVPSDKKVAFRKAISRLAKDGVIVKVGSGKFYKRGYRRSAPIEPVHIKPRRKEWLKSGKVPADILKYRLSRNLFWSNPKGKVPVENVIVAVIENGALDDLDFIRFSFGDDKVKEVFLKHFDIHSKPMIRNILDV